MHQYRAALSALLADTVEHHPSVLMQDPLSPAYHSRIENLHQTIVDSCTIASRQHIPRSRSGRKPRVAGWNDRVRPLCDTALFWHAIWTQCGRPATGPVACIRRRTRAEYHRMVKIIKQESDLIEAEKMADALVNNSSRNFWTEASKMKRTSKAVPSTIDGACGDEEIANIFLKKYKSLYNQVSYNDADIEAISEEVESRISALPASRANPTSLVSLEQVKEAMKSLNKGKRDGGGFFSTDHLINGGDVLCKAITILFCAMLRCGYTPTPMLASVIIPIPKSLRKSLSDSGNYRGIALNSPISKLFELVLLAQHRDSLATSELQFGFKGKSSTTQCTFVLLEIMQYFLNRDTPVYTMFLDASQAFDNLQYVKLFNRLLDRNLCPIACRALLRMHIGQAVTVRWGNTTTGSFQVRNGVKQGGIISPVLFTLYADMLLEALRKCGQGCHIGRTFTGAVAYADDIALMAPTRTALTSMLSIASRAGQQLCIKFNAGKCQLVKFSPSQSSVTNELPIEFNGQLIPFSDGAIHLGHYVGLNMRSEAVDRTTRDFYSRFNLIMAKFSHCNVRVKYRLMKSHCMSVYGSSLWDFASPSSEPFFVAWRKCIRRLLGVPSTTHCRLLPLILGDVPIQQQLHRRFTRFVASCRQSPSSLVRLCSRHALHGSGSATSNSITLMCASYGLRRESWPRTLQVHPQPRDPTSSAIIDVISLRDSSRDPNVNLIIDALCTE